MSAEAILKLIESSEPADTALLDEIDARVACYVNTSYEQTFIRLCDGGSKFWSAYKFGEEKGTRRHNLVMRYTRSRDALKSIRPEGWQFKIYAYGEGYSTASAYKNGGDYITIGNGFDTTEELAELYAIIQAIQHERNAKAGEDLP